MFGTGEDVGGMIRDRPGSHVQQRLNRKNLAATSAKGVQNRQHSFGRRLRAAGITEEDRKALLGHKNGSITSHYSGVELGQLIDATNKVSATDSRGPVLTILKRRQA